MMINLYQTPPNLSPIGAVCDSLRKTFLSLLVDNLGATGGHRLNSSLVAVELIIFPLFLPKGNAILPITPKAVCAGEIPWSPSSGFHLCSGYISPYIQTSVIIQTFSISKRYISSIVLPGRAILAELILRIGPYCPGDEALRVCRDPVENSVAAALRNTLGQESNTRRVKF